MPVGKLASCSFLSARMAGDHKGIMAKRSAVMCTELAAESTGHSKKSTRAMAKSGARSTTPSVGYDFD